MKKTVLSVVLGAVAVTGAAFAMSDMSDAIAMPRHIPEELRLKATDRFLGEKDAPVQIVEYASMTCGHCEKFHTNVVSKLKETYVKEGKVRFVLRELPWDNMALAVAKVARCAPAEQHYNFIDAFFATRENWIQDEKPLDAIKKIARLGGMGGDAVEACLKNDEVQEEVLANKKGALEKLDVKGTPTIFINGEVVEGSLDFKILSKKIDALLAK